MRLKKAFDKASVVCVCAIQHATFLRMSLLAVATFLVVSCRDEKEILTPEIIIISPADSVISSQGLSGFYLLNEGNMGSNKASLDYYDFATGTYTRNIYANANPFVSQELGDVGNDLKIYGSKLYAVINCSNMLEVMDAHSARHIGSVSVSNCRYLAFDGAYVYLSSYAGPVSLKPSYQQIGYVAKIDTASLEVVATCNVGFQPDEIEVADGFLYVANSGGYMGPDYESTLSVIDLSSFTEVRRIEVAPNLHRLRLDAHNQLWVSSRGDYQSTPPRLFCLSLADESVVEQYDLSVADMDLVGDSLFVITSEANSKSNGYMIIDVCSHAIVNDGFLSDEQASLRRPYSIKVNPINGDIYVSDAKDYVSPGSLYCFNTNGMLKWQVTTGDIPAHMAFVSSANHSSSTPSAPSTLRSPFIKAVDEYMPAPGQFVNILPRYDDGDSMADMLRKCTEALANDARGMVTLGAYGGYITFHFDHSVKNVAGKPDFAVYGNAIPGGSEAAIVMVSSDANANGIPDDEWFELKGSANDVISGYSITYSPSPMSDIPWSDNHGNSGCVYRNDYHHQEYYPKWMADSLTFSGSLLPSNARKGDVWTLDAFDWGYADNKPNNDLDSNSFDISNAIDKDGNTICLDYADFFRIYTAINQSVGELGETSSEITGAVDLHPDL